MSADASAYRCAISPVSSSISISAMTARAWMLPVARAREERCADLAGVDAQLGPRAVGVDQRVGPAPEFGREASCKLLAGDRLAQQLAPRCRRKARRIERLPRDRPFMLGTRVQAAARLGQRRPLDRLQPPWAVPAQAQRDSGVGKPPIGRVVIGAADLRAAPAAACVREHGGMPLHRGNRGSDRRGIDGQLEFDLGGRFARAHCPISRRSGGRRRSRLVALPDAAARGPPAASCRSNADRRVPADAGVGDRLAVVERLAGRQILAAFVEMAFDHHAEDALLAGGHLRGDVVRRPRSGAGTACWLLACEKSIISRGARPASREFGAGGLDAGRVVVGRLAAAQDDVAVLVAGGRDDGRVARLGDRKEMVRAGAPP